MPRIPQAEINMTVAEINLTHYDPYASVKRGREERNAKIHRIYIRQFVHGAMKMLVSTFKHKQT